MNIVLQANVMSYLEIVISIVAFDPFEDIPAVNEKFDGLKYENEIINIKD